MLIFFTFDSYEIWFNFLGFFTQAKSLRTWQLALLETQGRLQFWKMVALEANVSLMVHTRDERVQHYLYLYLYLLTIWIICIRICTRTGRGLTRKWAGFNLEVGRVVLKWAGLYVILSMQLIWVDQKLLYLLLIRKLFTWQHQHWASDQWFWSR